jgi:HK97 family phage major capsid protein
MEYRQAFKKYVQTGAAIPEKFAQRDAMTANTETLGATIPTTVINEFINEIQKKYGNLYAKVRKMNVPGAVKFPIGKLQATAKWINESTVSPRQDGGDFETVEFSYNTLEIRVSQTLLSSIVALDLFEREVVNVMIVAYLQALDVAIVNGTGNGQPLGIAKDPRVTNYVEMSATDINSWIAWRKKFFAKLPLGYRGGEFIFPVSTVDAYLETMADANNNPIFRQATGLEVNDGDAMNLYQRVKRGDVDQCSFGFDIVHEETDFREDGSVHWTITDVDLFEVSACTFPAYEATNISAREKQRDAMKARELSAWKNKTKERIRHGA